MKKLKIVDVCNDYVAVMLSHIDSELVVDKAVLKYENEGVIVGVGPLVDTSMNIGVGDEVIIQHKKYVTINSAAGGYSGTDIVIVKAVDILVRVHLNNDEEYTFVPWGEWHEDDEKQEA